MRLFSAGYAALPSPTWHALRTESVPVPLPLPMTLAGVGALAANLMCTVVLVKVRRIDSSPTRAPFLSARSDAIANVAIIFTGGFTALLVSPWPT